MSFLDFWAFKETYKRLGCGEDVPWGHCERWGSLVASSHHMVTALIYVPTNNQILFLRAVVSGYKTLHRVLPLVPSPEGTLAAHTMTVLLSYACVTRPAPF